MLRNRSRAVTSKQAFMADPSHQSSSKKTKSFFGSPRFGAFTTKGLFETEVMMSPTTILDTKPFFPFGNPFGFDLNHPKSPRIFSENKQNSGEKLDPKWVGVGVGLALIHNPVEENYSSKQSKKMVLFGAKLRVQIPPLSPTESLKSPMEFGIKTRDSQSHPNSGTPTKYSPRTLTGSVPVSEMELSEDYTCVILHGPNPKTTHIFDNCIVDSYHVVPPATSMLLPPESFLSSCYTCKRSLEHKNDIYIYRGEKAFCSQECRYQEMVSDGLEK
ncbi:hypothetical protein SLE2022_245180 [Rubroshorea leprosula]